MDKYTRLRAKMEIQKNIDKHPEGTTGILDAMATALRAAAEAAREAAEAGKGGE